MERSMRKPMGPKMKMKPLKPPPNCMCWEQPRTAAQPGHPLILRTSLSQKGGRCKSRRRGAREPVRPLRM
eukprot:10854006-Alexandrium_andersonii.AAC.1